MQQKTIIFADGCSRGNPGPAAIGAVLLTTDGRVIKEISQTIGRATNNVAEYKALIAALSAAHGQSCRFLDIRLDSELVVKQIKGEYRTKKLELKPLLSRARQLLQGFEGHTINHVPRAQNRAADALCNMALDRTGV